MADPRFNHYGQRTQWHARQPRIDSPTCYGWVRIGENERGLSIFELGRAFMRPTSPEDRTAHDWLVFIGSEVYGYNGELAEITADVRRMLGLTEPYFMPNYTIPLSAFGGNK